MDSNVNAMASIDDLDPKRTAIVVGPFLGLLSAPVVFQVVRVVEQEHSIMSDLIASVLTTLLCVAFMVLINSYLEYSCHLAKQDQLLKAYQQRSVLYKIISAFQGSNRSSPKSNESNQNSSFSFLHSDRSFASEHEQHKRKIETKYFKPKFIINELMTFWGTTCTVITWGSFYVIGGTIVATERMAQKIKTKRTNSRENSFFSSSFSGQPNRGTGQSDSFLNMSFRSSSGEEAGGQEQTNNRYQNFKKISTWTKRSYASIKRKFSRVVTSSSPHFNSLTSALNTSTNSS